MTGATPPRPGVRFAARGHIRIAYVVTGPDDGDPGIPTVCFLHGLLLGRDTFAPVREGLAAHGPVRTIEIDARGHGASAALTDRGYTMIDAAMETLAVLDRAGITVAHVVGHDLGGMSALVLTSLAPARVASLTLVEPAVEALLLASPDPAVRSRGEAVRRVRREIAEAAYKGLLDKALGRYAGERWGPAWKDEMSASQQAAIRRNAGALASSLRALDDASVAPTALANLHIPVTLVNRHAGSADDPMEATLLTRWLPSASMLRIEPTRCPRSRSAETPATPSGKRCSRHCRARRNHCGE